MPTIVKKGTNPSAFRLSNGKVITLQVGAGGGQFLNVIQDCDFELLMKEYSSFILPRVITDKNPHGCFIIHDSSSYVRDMSQEVGEIKDGSAQIDISKVKKKGRRK